MPVADARPVQQGMQSLPVADSRPVQQEMQSMPVVADSRPVQQEMQSMPVVADSRPVEAEAAVPEGSEGEETDDCQQVRCACLNLCWRLRRSPTVGSLSSTHAACAARSSRTRLGGLGYAHEQGAWRPGASPAQRSAQHRSESVCEVGAQTAAWRRSSGLRARRRDGAPLDSRSRRTVSLRHHLHRAMSRRHPPWRLASLTYGVSLTPRPL
jgi:hypothetical protein